jgi:hypothetical protein
MKTLEHSAGRWSSWGASGIDCSKIKSISNITGVNPASLPAYLAESGLPSFAKHSYDLAVLQ